MEKIKKQTILVDSPISAMRPIPLDPRHPTAVFFIGEHIGIGMITLKKVLELFPHQYKNFIFLSIGEVNCKTYDPEADANDINGDVKNINSKVIRRLSIFVNYCRSRNLPALHFQTNHTDIIDGLAELAKKISSRYPHCVFFAGKLIFDHENWINHWLHNHTATLIEQRLQSQGLYTMLLPICLSSEPEQPPHLSY